MVIGVSSTPGTQKWPFSATASSSRLISLASSSKPRKRREVCLINKAFPKITMFGTYSQFYGSCHQVGESPINKCDYILNANASPPKMIPRNQSWNSFNKKSFGNVIVSQPKVDKKREQGFRNFGHEQFQNNPHRVYGPMPAESTNHIPRSWDQERRRLRESKAEASLHSKTRCLQGEVRVAETQESKQATGVTISKMLKSIRDGTVTSSKTECLQDEVATAEAQVSKQAAAVTTTNVLYFMHDRPVTSSKPECIQAGSSYSLNQETMNPKQSHLLELKLDKNNNQEHGHARSSVERGSNPNHEESMTDSTDPKFTGNKKVDKTNLSPADLHKKLASVYSNVMVVDNVSAAKEVVRKLTHEYKHLVHACDTEVAKIDVKQETPVDHGEMICFSIYSGPTANFGNGKSCIWVDLLDGDGRGLLNEFAPFFEDQSIKKVWHNYSFDNHVIENYGLKISGFFADTMHMARLWDSSRRTEGGYSLEALTGDQRVVSKAETGYQVKDLMGKISMKTIFGRRKVKKDGSEGKMITIPPVDELQREERKLWICYSALDAISTLNLFESLKKKLSNMAWILDGKPVLGKSMFNFYQQYWQPFGEILVKMETEGMLVDRTYLAEIEKVAKAEQEAAVNRFRNWACKYCPDARYMNVGSDTQLRQLLFGGTLNSKDCNESLPEERIFKVPNTEGVIEEGKKTASKYRNIRLCSIGVHLPTEKYTATGWPSVSGDALKSLAGNISAQYDFVDATDDLPLEDDSGSTEETDVSETNNSTVHKEAETSAPVTNIKIFGTEEEAREACQAIAALCEVCSIDSLISNFILPLQGSNVSGKNGRVHCSLNINTETGRLSARRPNLQNQPALEKDRYKIRQAFVAAPGNSLIVADYGQLELRILAHLAKCKSMLDAFEAGGDFHSRTAMNMYSHIRDAVEAGQVILEWHPQPGEEKPPVPLLKDAFGSERRKAKMLNFSIAYGKTPVGLARDWKVSVEEAKQTVDLWYKERQEVLTWQEDRKKEARKRKCVHTLLGRARRFPSMESVTRAQRNHIERAAINTPVQGSAADVAMCAMLEISKNNHLKELGWRLLLQVHDEVILEGPSESAEVAKAIVVECMSKPFNGKNILRVDLSVDAKCAQNWYSAK